MPLGKWMRKLILICITAILISCNPNKREPEIVQLKDAPSFNADSAYAFIETQLAFGPRVPTTNGHLACGNYLVDYLSGKGFKVTEQFDSVVGYDQRIFPLRNIIASSDTANPKRLALCAHWDSRPYTDQATERQTDSLVGANDNASGVAILLEVARCISSKSPDVGVDIVLFDMEDQGRPAFETSSDADDHGYCLGSKHWANNFNGVLPKYAVLFDMVGARDAVFTLEGVSMLHAKDVMYKVWDMGHQLGYSGYFQYNRTRPIYDDHKYVNEILQVPCIDIIQHDATTSTGFGTFWHTHEDNLELIDTKTLEAVGQTITQVVYNESSQ